MAEKSFKRDHFGLGPDEGSSLYDTPTECRFDEDPERTDCWICLDCGEHKLVDEMRTMTPDLRAETGEWVGSCKDCYGQR